MRFYSDLISARQIGDHLKGFLNDTPKFNIRQGHCGFRYSHVRVFENVVNDTEQVFGARVHVLGVFLKFFERDRRLIFLSHEIGKADERIQGRS